MAGNDPFAEPEGDDGERTVIRPNPGGRRTSPAAGAGAGAGAAANPFGAPPQPAQPAPAGVGATAGGVDAFGVPQGAQVPRATASGGAAPDAQIAMTGMNTLVACAAPLFALLGRIRNRAQHMDPDGLRQAVVGEVRAFESRALSAQIDPQQVKVARYALCATIDDVVLNTPWGGQSNWALQSLVGTFHRETVGGDRFYDLLARLEQEPAQHLPLLEFLYVCLSLGFEGRLRVEARGSDKHLQIRNSLARIIRGQRGSVEQDLSPHWKGVERPYRPRSLWKPVWIALGATAALMALTFSTYAFLLGRQAGPVIGLVQALAPSTPPRLERPAPPPPPPPVLEETTTAPPADADSPAAPTVREFLAHEIEAKKVEVAETPTELMVRILGTGLFKSASDQLEDGLEPIITKIGAALSETEGPVLVVGYTDSVPFKGRGRLKDNTQLSAARAETVARILAEELGGRGRLSVEGRGPEDPIADNATAEGRALNRRVEVLLLKQEQEAE